MSHAIFHIINLHITKFSPTFGDILKHNNMNYETIFLMYINYRMTPEGVSVITKEEASELLSIGEKGYWALLRHLKSTGVIEEVNQNGFYKTLKVHKILPVYSFLLDSSLSKADKDLMARVLLLHGTEYAVGKVVASKLGVNPHTYNAGKYSLESKLKKDMFEYLRTVTVIPSESLPGIEITPGGAKNVQRRKGSRYISGDERLRRKLANIPHSLYMATKNCAKRRKAEHFLTEEDIKAQLEKQDYKCYYTGLPFSDKVIPSVDRIDSNITYQKDNIVICDARANIMKQSMSVTEFLEMIDLIYNNRKGKI
jgi:hypothetical protein